MVCFVFWDVSLSLLSFKALAVVDLLSMLDLEAPDIVDLLSKTLVEVSLYIVDLLPVNGWKVNGLLLIMRRAVQLLFTSSGVWHLQLQHLSISLCVCVFSLSSLSSWLTGVLRMMCPRKNTAQCQSLSLLFASFLAAAMKDASSHLSFGLKTFSQYILCPVSNYDIYVALFQSPPLATHC